VRGCLERKQPLHPLFTDIATECGAYVHVPQLRKHAVAYARILTSSVSYLAALKEILPPQSQREEIDSLSDTLARVPLPIVVLLDDVDRMQRGEILTLLKISRGVHSMPNLTFVCAFSEREVRRELNSKNHLSVDCLDKFFPVTVNLAPPAPEVLGSVFRTSLIDTLREQKWFWKKGAEKKFAELLERAWNGAIGRRCTNLRKLGLLIRDIATTARPIAGEVNPFDLTIIETIRRFYPDVYRTVRQN
jgi:KAP-like P-loop domain-containing protein